MVKLQMLYNIVKLVDLVVSVRLWWC